MRKMVETMTSFGESSDLEQLIIVQTPRPDYYQKIVDSMILPPLVDNVKEKWNNLFGNKYAKRSLINAMRFDLIRNGKINNIVLFGLLGIGKCIIYRRQLVVSPVRQCLI